MSSMEYDGVEITWLGHASFRIKGTSTIMYIDPYVIDEHPPKGDVVLVTHEHYDHCSMENIPILLKKGGVVITTKGCADTLDIEARVVREGDEVTINDVTVEVVPAYNISKPFHPRGFGVGFIVEIDGVRIYHAGDTDLIPEMKDVVTDVALLPIGGTYTMGPEDAVEAASLIKPGLVIPMHYNYLSGLEQDATLFAESVKKRMPDIEVRTLE
ncbi:MAG: MBL fold metallo-hydrolase [Methermicoccaceae archaeon]